MSVRSGFSTVEVLMALVVFAIGALGAAGSMALAWRAELAGESAAVAARAAGSVLDSLRAEVTAGAGRCDRLTSGWRIASQQVTLDWSTAPAGGGREIYLGLSLPSIAAAASDTVWTFIACR